MIGRLRRLLNGGKAPVAGPSVSRRGGAGNVGRLIRAGDASNRARRWAEAEEAYAQALQLDPELAAVWVQYGHSLKEQGHFSEAEDAYRHALALDDSAADTHLQLGHVLKLQTRVADAITAYQAAYARDRLSQDAIRELQALGAEPVISVDTAKLFARQRRVPPDFPPSIIATRSDDADIIALHLLLLGRFPENGEVFRDHRGRPIVDVSRDLVRSGEFHRLVVIPLIAGRGTRHDRLAQAEFELVKTWLERFGGDGRDAPLGWVELLRRYLRRKPLNEIFSEAVIAALQPELEQSNGRELIGRLFGEEGISIQLLLDGDVATEFEVNGVAPAQGCSQDDMTRFRLSIPIEAFDGRDHDITVREARTLRPVPSSRFTAHLVPAYEGVIVGSAACLKGWIRRTPPSDHKVTIELRDGERVLGSTVADQSSMGPLVGAHGFDLPVPAFVPATATVWLDGVPVKALVDRDAAPTQITRGTWQISLGRSNVMVIDEHEAELSPFPLGFNFDSVAQSVARYGRLYVLDGIHELAARGDDLEPAILETLRYVAVAKDYQLLRLLDEWMSFLSDRPRVFEQLMRVYLDAGDFDAAQRLIQQVRTRSGEWTVGIDLVESILRSCETQTIGSRDRVRLDPFATAPSHRDVVNSTYHSLLVTIERQRLLIERLLDAVESRQSRPAAS